MPKINFDELQLAEIPDYSEASELAKYVGGHPFVEVVRPKFKKGHKAHPHTHPEEVFWYVVKGRVRVNIGDESFEAETGQGWHTPPNVPHHEEFLEDTTGIAFKVLPAVRE